MSQATMISRHRPTAAPFHPPRVAVRHWGDDGGWNVLRAQNPDDSPVEIMSVSDHDLFLDADRPFQPGALLTVELAEPGIGPLRKLVRVAEVEPGDNGRWLHLCLFIVPLETAAI